jgi:hypothetical protein
LARLHKELDSTAADLRVTVQNQLEEAKQIGRNDPQHAAAMYRAMIELYGDKPWAKEVVEQAREALDDDKSR